MVKKIGGCGSNNELVVNKNRYWGNCYGSERGRTERINKIKNNNFFKF